MNGHAHGDTDVANLERINAAPWLSGGDCPQEDTVVIGGTPSRRTEEALRCESAAAAKRLCFAYAANVPAHVRTGPFDIKNQEVIE